MDVVTSGSDEQTQRWQRQLEVFVRLARYPSGFAPPNRAHSYFVLSGGEVAVLHRSFDDKHDFPGQNHARALIGPPDVLSVPVSLGLHSWSGWRRTEPARKLAVPEVVRSGRAGEQELNAQANQVGPDLEYVLARLHDAPNRPVSIVGCPERNRIAMLWGIYNRTHFDHLAAVERGPGWTYSTYETERSDLIGGLPLPWVVFLDLSTDWDPASRTVIDLNEGHRQNPAPAGIELAGTLVGGPGPAWSPPPIPPRPDIPGPGSALAPAPAPAAGWFAELADQRSRHRWTGNGWATMWRASDSIFVSYARPDEDAVRELVDDLRSARLTVWFDDELETNDVWWAEILRRIRDAAVFVHALSDHALASLPCRSEQEYASALGIPIVPVQVGPANLRLAPAGQRQVVDYRKRERRQAIRLVADVLREQRRRVPTVGSPPLPPPLPFGYLLTLAGELDAPALAGADQHRILAELGGHLDSADGDRVRADIVALLTKLRRRPDALHRVVTMAGEMIKTTPT